MSRKVWIETLGITLVLLVTLAVPSTAMAQGKAITRPISDWLAAQGSMSAAAWETLLGFPFIASYVAWSGRTGPHEDITLLMVVDYASLDAAAVEAESGGDVVIPTEIQGSVIERPLSDGRTEVHVTLHTRNALTYVLDFTSFVFGDIFFGATPSEVAAGAAPALGDSALQAVYIVPRAPGEPMEDLVRVSFAGALGESGTELLFESFQAAAAGEFRAASGVPEGTPGRASTHQTGLLGVFAHNTNGALADAFPAEWIDLHVTGK